MSHFLCLRRKYFRFCTIFVILAFHARQFETKRISDIYTTLISYIVPDESDTFLQINCSFNSTAEMPSNSAAKSKLKSHPGLYFSAKPAYDITDIRATVNISIERGGRYDRYLSIEVDLCALRYSVVLQPLIRFLRDELIRVVKPREFCPIKKNVLFEINNFMLSNSFLPPYVPQLNWKQDLKVSLNGRYSLTIVSMGKIEWINIK